MVGVLAGKGKKFSSVYALQSSVGLALLKSVHTTNLSRLESDENSR